MENLNIPLVSDNDPQPSNLSPSWLSKLDLVKRMYAKKCDADEVELFLYTAKKYGLDPLNKEIWAIKYGSNPAMIMCSRDGYISVAHRSGQFDGMETTYCDKDKSATCVVYRKDMKYPVKSTVYLEEFNKSSNALWQTKPRVMIQKVSEAFSLRRAFPVNGTYTPEEIDKNSFKDSNNDPVSKEVEVKDYSKNGVETK